MKESTLGFGTMKTMFDFFTARFGLKRLTTYGIAYILQNVFYGIATLGLWLNMGPAQVLHSRHKRGNEQASRYTIVGDCEKTCEIAAFVACMFWFIPVSIIGIIFYTIPYFIAQFIFAASFLTAVVIERHFRGYSRKDRYSTKENDK